MTLASSQGPSWGSLTGTTDGFGNFTIVATGTHDNTVWWQTYLNGTQPDVSALSGTWRIVGWPWFAFAAPRAPTALGPV